MKSVSLLQLSLFHRLCQCGTRTSAGPKILVIVTLQIFNCIVSSAVVFRFLLAAKQSVLNITTLECRVSQDKPIQVLIFPCIPT
jgi:hypothetical protein